MKQTTQIKTELKYTHRCDKLTVYKMISFPNFNPKLTFKLKITQLCWPCF